MTDTVAAPGHGLERRARNAAVALGLAGALPFLGLALGVWLLPSAQGTWALGALIAYGAVILSFLGGIHWGLALQGGVPRVFVISVIPSLLAWVALLLPPTLALSLLTVCLVAQLALDLRIRMAPWFRVLRAVLTAAAAGSLLLASMAPATA
ncbi:DUF3429 domain-containing protein [Aquisalimonas asiatica]|uniref:DUF3429 domain-containing protein n=1 Tax=Aquisalimonas asiatica TaxID=406100 RepID=A0A1H8U2D8_9GAMM|nr:DUF3429 domain-containing protein [Aquisalimonas asiatica]SEO97277.1 Protein of unknown function [Aquisalimonas asiatica]